MPEARLVITHYPDRAEFSLRHRGDDGPVLHARDDSPEVEREVEGLRRTIPALHAYCVGKWRIGRKLVIPLLHDNSTMTTDDDVVVRRRPNEWFASKAPFFMSYDEKWDMILDACELTVAQYNAHRTDAGAFRFPELWSWRDLERFFSHPYVKHLAARKADGDMFRCLDQRFLTTWCARTGTPILGPPSYLAYAGVTTDGSRISRLRRADLLHYCTSRQDLKAEAMRRIGRALEDGD